jgi:hypothetical protein
VKLINADEIVYESIDTSDTEEYFAKYGTGILVVRKEDIDKMPSAEEESFEWCTDCKEYDQEAHCCHRWSKMIRKTVDEMQIVRCKDCIYADYMDDVKALWCSEGGRGKTVAPEDFCSYGERKEVTG